MEIPGSFDITKLRAHAELAGIGVSLQQLTALELVSGIVFNRFSNWVDRWAFACNQGQERSFILNNHPTNRHVIDSVPGNAPLGKKQGAYLENANTVGIGIVQLGQRIETGTIQIDNSNQTTYIQPEGFKNNFNVLSYIIDPGSSSQIEQINLVRFVYASLLPPMVAARIDSLSNVKVLVTPVSGKTLKNMLDVAAEIGFGTSEAIITDTGIVGGDLTDEKKGEFLLRLLQIQQEAVRRREYA